MLYDEYGDQRAMERNYPAMKKWIDHEATFVKDGLMPKDHYGDWCVPPEDPKLIHSVDPTRITNPTLLGSSYYYELLRTMARYARLLEKTRRCRRFRQARRTSEHRLPEALFQARQRHVR